MKKLIAILLTAVLVCAVSITAFAVETPQATQNPQGRWAEFQKQKEQIAAKKAEWETKKQQWGTKQAEFLQFRISMNESRVKMLENAKANLTLRQENNKLRVDITKSLAYIKENKIQLSDETMALLKDYNTQISEILVGFKETKGNINDIIKQNKEFFKNKDYVALDAAFQQIYTIQQFRNDQLKQINVLLQEMIKTLATQA